MCLLPGSTSRQFYHSNPNQFNFQYRDIRDLPPSVWRSNETLMEILHLHCLLRPVHQKTYDHYGMYYRTQSIIRAVAEQRSSPILCLANKTKMHLKQKNELEIARVWGCSIFCPPAPPHGRYPGVRSYGMEADPPRFLYLKDEYFLMTDWCDIDISLIMKNSKSMTLTSRSVRRWGWNFRPISNIWYSIC